MVQRISILGKVGLEDVEVAIQIVIPDSDAHSRLFHSVIAQGYATCNPILFECPVVLIDEEEARGRVGSNIYVGPTIFVEVRCYHGHSIVGP